MLIYDQFGIIQNLQTLPTPQTSFLVGTFFAPSHSKMALAVAGHFYSMPIKISISQIDKVTVLKVPRYSNLYCREPK